MGAVFRLVKPQTVTVVAHPVPPDGAEAARIKLTLRYLSMSERKALTARLLDERVADADLAGELVTGWSGVVDEAGEVVAFSAEALAAALDIPFVHDAIRDAVIAELFGRGLAKNSETPAGDGRPASGT